MKKSILIALIIGVAAFAVGLIGVLTSRDTFSNTIDGEFSINNDRLQGIINSGEFSVETLRQAGGWDDLTDNVGSVENAATARKEAVKVWNKLYGKAKIRGETPYNVYYDSENEVWLVHGTLPEGLIGGTAHILLKKSGDIIAVWHEL